MKILVACEESQEVCKAFRKRGHQAYSCDLLPCSGGHPEWHIQEDAIWIIKNLEWDMIIAHPPCTYLSCVSNRLFNIEKYGDKAWRRCADRWTAAAFFMEFILADCPKIAVENPMGVMNTWYRKPDQIIDPYMFASSKDDEVNYQRKRTCLWLKGLPLLRRTNNYPPPEPIKTRVDIHGRMRRVYYTENCGVAGRGSLPDSARPGIRSKTFPAIAEAMAEQWGGI